MHSQKAIQVASISLFAAIILAHSNAAISSVSVAEPKQRAHILFVQNAAKGFITQDKVNPSCYQISLSQLNQHMIYFKDQPARSTGIMTWSQFEATWQHNDITPNAAIHAVDPIHIGPVNDMVVLSQFKYDKILNKAQYKACVLSSKTVFVPGKITNVSIFIEPFHS